jgi:hypothetical protein
MPTYKIAIFGLMQNFSRIWWSMLDRIKFKEIYTRVAETKVTFQVWIKETLFPLGHHSDLREWRCTVDTKYIPKPNQRAHSK